MVVCLWSVAICLHQWTKNTRAWILMRIMASAKMRVGCFNIFLRIGLTIRQMIMMERVAYRFVYWLHAIFFLYGCYLPFKMKMMRRAFKMWSFLVISIMSALLWGLKEIFRFSYIFFCLFCVSNLQNHVYHSVGLESKQRFTYSSIVSIAANHLCMVCERLLTKMYSSWRTIAITANYLYKSVDV